MDYLAPVLHAFGGNALLCHRPGGHADFRFGQAGDAALPEAAAIDPLGTVGTGKEGVDLLLPEFPQV